MLPLAGGSGAGDVGREQRRRGGRHPGNPRGLADGIRPDFFEPLNDLRGEPWQTSECEFPDGDGFLLPNRANSEAATSGGFSLFGI